MSKMNYFESGLDNLGNQGDALSKLGEEKVENARETAEAMDRIQMTDEETQAIIDRARENMRRIKSEIAENEVAAPMEEVTTGLQETGNEAGDAAAMEKTNADTMAEVGGDYGDIAAGAADALNQRAEEFTGIKEKAAEMHDRFKEQTEAATAALESMF